MWAVGQIGWSVYEVGQGIELPTPSWVDGPFLLSAVLVIAGLIGMVRTPAGRLSQLRAALEGVLIAGGLFLCSWVLVVGPVVRHGSGSVFSQVVNLAYPVLDVVALAAVLFVGIYRRNHAPAGLRLLALGIICVAIGDSMFWYISATRPEFPGVTPLDTVWIAAFGLIAVAALSPLDARPRLTGRQAARLLPFVPLISAATGIVILALAWAVSGEPRPIGVVVVTLAVLLIAAIALRVIATYENGRLADDLERRVRVRTAQLHATERYYRALVQHSSDTTLIVDSDLQIRYASDSLYRTLGCSADRLIGRHLDELGADASGPLAEALAELAPCPARATRVQWSLKDESGRVRQVESTVTNMLTDTDVAGFVLNTRDVTDRAALEDQLRHQAAIVESSQDAIIAQDRDGTITSWNTGAARLYGYTASEAIGRPVSMLAPAARAEENAEILGRVVRGEPLEHYQTERVRKGGTAVTVSLSVAPLHDSAGQVIGASSITSDIGPAVRAQEQIALQAELLDEVDAAVTLTDREGSDSVLESGR